MISLECCTICQPYSSFLQTYFELAFLLLTFTIPRLGYSWMIVIFSTDYEIHEILLILKI